MSKHNQPTRPVQPQAGGARQPTPEELAAREEAEDSASGDERVVRRADSDGRGDRGAPEPERDDLANLMSDDDYEALVKAEFEHTALPKPPALQGWHLCWLTTTSQYDNIAKRQRLGYRPVRRDEMPGFDPSNGQDLERFQGYITCNEMVLHKIPEAYYQRMMAYFHHKEPGDRESGTLQKARGLPQEAQQDSSGRDLSELVGTGYLDMEQSVKRTVARSPRFHS